MILLDTDVVSAFMREQAEQAVVRWLDRQPKDSVWISAITVMEIRYGLEVMPKGRRKEALARAFEELLEIRIEGRIAPFDEAAAEQAAVLMGQRRVTGHPGDTEDAMIAGIAQATGATVATRNVGHFADLSVRVVNPWEG